MKNLIIILSSIIVFIGFAYLGLNLLAKHIYNRTDCDRFNIDNIEMRAHINIPSIESQDCNCENNTKTSIFVFESDVNLEDYIQKNHFVKENEIYVNQGERVDTKWRAVLNLKTAELSVIIEYK